MTVIPCERDAIVRAQIERFVETLKTVAHLLGNHGLTEKEFHESPILRGAIEVMRGEYSAKLGPKREFVQHVLNHLEDGGLPQEVNFVDFELAQRGGGTRRRTIIRRDGIQQRASRMTPIRRA